MANIVANVVDGKLDYNYTDSAAEKKQEALGSNLGYDQFLQLLCAEMQYQDPLEPTSNTDYVAQLATFSQLEATLAMQNTMTDDMANNLVGKTVTIEQENETTGKTTTVTGNVDFISYQDGEAYVSVDGSLYTLDTIKKVTDPDYDEALELADTIHSMLAQMPDIASLTAIYEGALSDIRTLYDSLNSYQRKLVSKSDVVALETLEGRMKELVTAQNERNKQLADAFAGKVAELPAAEELTVDNKEAVEAARAAYEGLTDAQKELAKDSLGKLTALEEKMAELTGSAS